MRRVVLALLLGVPLVFADGKAKQAAPDYTAEEGRRAVLSKPHFLLGDLQCRATFAAGDDKLPVIVFCHELYGSKDAHLKRSEAARLYLASTGPVQAGKSSLVTYERK